MHYTKWEREWTESDGISAPYIQQAKQHFHAAAAVVVFSLLYFSHERCSYFNSFSIMPKTTHTKTRTRFLLSRQSLRVSRETWNMYRIHTWNERTVASSHIPILKMVRNMADVWWYLWLNLSLPHGETLKHGWIIE